MSKAKKSELKKEEVSVEEVQSVAALTIDPVTLIMNSIEKLNENVSEFEKILGDSIPNLFANIMTLDQITQDLYKRIAKLETSIASLATPKKQRAKREKKV